MPWRFGLKTNTVAMLEVGYKFCKYLRRFLCLWLLGSVIYIVMLGGVNEVHISGLTSSLGSISFGCDYSGIFGLVTEVESKYCAIQRLVHMLCFSKSCCNVLCIVVISTINNCWRLTLILFFFPPVWEWFFSRIGQCKSIAFLCSKISTPTTISDFAVLYYIVFQLLMWCLNVRPRRWICMCFYLLFYQFAIFFFEHVSWFEVHYYFVWLGGLRAMFNILCWFPIAPAENFEKLVELTSNSRSWHWFSGGQQYAEHQKDILRLLENWHLGHLNCLSNF